MSQASILDRAAAPRVSIGLPVYNGQTWLAGAIEALLAQTFTDFELIISDNASTDETEAICRSYAARDERIRYCRQVTNRGSTWNFNHVFHLARGEYFKWAAFVERCLEVLDREPEVAWCHCRSKHIDAQGKLLLGESTPEISYVNLDRDGASVPAEPTRDAPRPSDRFRAVILGHDGCLDSYGLIRSDILKKTALYLPYFGSEKVLMAELALWGRYHEIPETLFYARVHENAAGSQKTGKKQRAFINPLAKGRWQFARIQLLRGYLGAVWRSKVDLAERLRCHGAILRYLFQVKKWRGVLAKALSGSGLAGEYPSIAPSAPAKASH
jgi:glycosyltransferase involved in cell wall biosynthesis